MHFIYQKKRMKIEVFGQKCITTPPSQVSGYPISTKYNLWHEVLGKNFYFDSSLWRRHSADNSEHPSHETEIFQRCQNEVTLHQHCLAFDPLKKRNLKFIPTILLHLLMWYCKNISERSNILFITSYFLESQNYYQRKLFQWCLKV